MTDKVVSRPGFADLWLRHKDEGDGTFAEVVESPRMRVKFDNDASGNPLYIGNADQGTHLTDAKWQIQKVIYAGGFPTDLVYADDSTEFNKVWNSRAAYTYTVS